MIIWTVALCGYVSDCFHQLSKPSSLQVNEDELKDAGSTISSSVEGGKPGTLGRTALMQNNKNRGSIFHKLVTYLVGLLLMILAGSRSDNNDIFDIASVPRHRSFETARQL